MSNQNAMGDESATAEWAQLVCVTDIDTPPFMIGKDKITIGRVRGCDISHENNNFVSGTHCYIMRDGSGKVWLFDTSTNGTVLNSKVKLLKGECREIQHGDEFFVVHKKGEEDVNIGYMFQDLARLKEEEERDNSDEMEQTLEYEDEPQFDATIADDSINEIDDEESERAVKRKRTPSETSADLGPCDKKAKTETNAAEMESVSGEMAATSTTASKQVEKTTTTPRFSLKPDVGEQKGVKEEGEEKKDGGSGDEKEEGAKSTGEKGGTGAKEEDVFEETLTCIICQELLHDCISLQPCMHSFCAGCYSEWMAHSSLCPSCRGTVDRINKNYMINSLIEAHLKKYPEKRRPEEDIKELEAKNKITRDMLFPKTRQADDSANSTSEDYSDSDDNDSRPSSSLTVAAPPVFGTVINAYKAVCRQCPGAAASTNQQQSILGTAVATATSVDTPSTSGNYDTNNNAGQASTSGATPSGADDVPDYVKKDMKKVMPVPPPYTCTVNQNHMLCQCCFQIFPNRSNESFQFRSIHPQQCIICHRIYCHAYWGCRRADCSGCLAKFGYMNFGRKVLPLLILDNPYESEIFKNYLESKRLAVCDVLQACMVKMQEGTYSCPDQAVYRMTKDTPLCFACALRNFKHLAYQYRAEIPRDQLPGEVTARPDCHWGKNCRTQRTKPDHAKRFNHICEQTRT